MSEAVEQLFKSGEEKMEKAITQLKREFATVRTGRANPSILDKVQVDYYGTPTPLRQMSQVTVQDGTTLVITPYDKTITATIVDDSTAKEGRYIVDDGTTTFDAYTENDNYHSNEQVYVNIP